MPAPRPYILAETNWKVVKDTPFEVAILPWGATEAHNYHLPYNTDVAQCDYVAAESAKVAWEAGAKVVVLPTIPFGVNTGQLDIKLDINMNPSTQLAVLRDVVQSLSGQGIKKLVVMNGHGGNDFKQMLRELQAQHPDMFLCTMNWFRALDWNKYFDESGDHAGEMETSAMMHIAPDLVLPLSQAGNGHSNKFKLKGLQEGWVWAQREWSKATNDTGVGNPAKASSEKGKAYLTDIAKQIGSFLVDLANADIKDMYER
ncbi:creatininase family protein [Pontibacter silvestris]|uniref:Creatininase family protein n=1 Tax=Pontibacter silvestris TaxID=2305183 RepID=A0ABW4WYY5_9BACT|nr:creatininase family protein [Pontibacter silvestris]MCC9135496.1 creatininase family protein [Pontibacter silvestris]